MVTQSVAFEVEKGKNSSKYKFPQQSLTTENRWVQVIRAVELKISIHYFVTKSYAQSQ